MLTKMSKNILNRYEIFRIKKCIVSEEGVLCVEADGLEKNPTEHGQSTIKVEHLYMLKN